MATISLFKAAKGAATRNTTPDDHLDFAEYITLDESQQPKDADLSIARAGESSRQHRWRDELLKTGIRGKGGQMLRFAELETLPDLRHLHCTGTLSESGERVVVSFGPEHAALEQRQVEMAMREAGELFPRPKMIVFCAFTFDPEAPKDIDQTKGIVALKAQMNTDLLTEDLKKARSSNQSFWLMGQPEVSLRELKTGEYQVEVHGFDYFDPAKGELVSGGKGKIAAWSLDTDYDERSLFPRQVFFPMAGAKDGWNKLRRDIKAELDESRLDKFHGTVSLPFPAGDNGKVAVKIVDDRGKILDTVDGRPHNRLFGRKVAENGGIGDSDLRPNRPGCKPPQTLHRDDPQRRVGDLLFADPGRLPHPRFRRSDPPGTDIQENRIG